jgi:hypothetical protein
VKLLLDEMVSAVVADQLRDRGFAVVAVQDPDRAHRRKHAHQQGDQEQ